METNLSHWCLWSVVLYIVNNCKELMTLCCQHHFYLRVASTCLRDMIATIILLTTLVYLFYKFWVSNYKYWDRRGIPSIPGKFPFGTDYGSVAMRTFAGHKFDELCQKFPSSPYFGMYMLRKPFLVIKDPKIFHLVLVKEFSSFKDRLFVKIPESYTLSHHLLTLDGVRWRALRNKLSPTFSSGRIKAMFPLFLKCSEAYDLLLQSHSGEIVDVKNLTSRFTIDTICSSAFGLETCSIQDENSDFIRIGKNVFSFSLPFIIKFMLIAAFPEMVPYVSMSLIPENRNSQLYVYQVVKETIKHREENNIRRNDFLDLLIQLKNKGSLEGDAVEETDENNPPFEMTLERVSAQCFVFFVAGFETSSAVQTFCLYELARNPLIQKKVQSEIDQILQLHNGLTYDAVNEMKYLDMVVSETLRKYPSFTNTSRVCTKSVLMPNGDTIEKGETILLPIWTLHHNPEYFPDPEKFDPERFSPENKLSINPYTYIPFGEGPRICIGKRFGQLQTKMGIITILMNHSVEPTESSEAPLELVSQPATAPKHPIKLKLISRRL